MAEWYIMLFHARRTAALRLASSSISSAVPRRKSSASRFVSVLVPWLVFSAAFLTSAANARGSAEDRPGWKVLSCPPVAPEEAREILTITPGLTTSPLAEPQVVMGEQAARVGVHGQLRVPGHRILARGRRQPVRGRRRLRVVSNL